MHNCELLAWDSAFFGFSVARIGARVADADALGEVLLALRERGVRLAYWFADPGERSERAADGLRGTRVGGRVLYRRDLAQAGEAHSAVEVVRYAGAQADDALITLAVQAGALSRFALDPAMPPGTAARMYRLWIERSVTGEIADAVYVAGGAPDRRAGMITTAAQDDAGVIGLLAVADGHRGAGIGRALVEAAHRHFRARGLARAQVATQEENTAANRLYEACAYRRARTDAVFHFWL